MVGGDTAQEAAFRAYVDTVNAAGGIGGRSLELVLVTPGQAAPGTVVTVNLSGRVVAGDGGERPAWVTGALLETLTATEAAQPAGGSVRSFASPPERQARLMAADLFATDTRGATAVVFTSASEPWRTIVPAAVEAVLSPLGVTVERVAYDPERPPALFPAADAAILSLDSAGVRSWVRHAKVTAYRPDRGVGGVSTLHDESLLPDLPEGTRFVSPYAVPPGAEGEAIRSAAGPVSAAGLHGWATAKMLAVALWHTGADTPDEVTGALARLRATTPACSRPTRPGAAATPGSPTGSSTRSAPVPSRPKEGSGATHSSPSHHTSAQGGHVSAHHRLRLHPRSLTRRVALVAATAAIGMVATAGPVLACAGLVTAGGNVKLLRTATLAAWHDGYEHYVTSFTFDGGGAEVGSLVPLPAVPDKVERGGDWTLSASSARRSRPPHRSGPPPVTPPRPRRPRRPRSSTRPRSTPSTSPSSRAAPRPWPTGPPSTATRSPPTPPRRWSTTPTSRRCSWPPASTPPPPRSGTSSWARARRSTSPSPSGSPGCR